MSIAAIAVVSLCLSSSDWYPIDLSSYNSNAREPGCCVDKQSIIHFSLPASHDNSGCSKHLLRWLLTVLPFSQSLTPHSTHDLPTSMSTIPCQSSLHYYLCFHGDQASKEKGVQTNARWWPGDTDSRIRLLFQSTRGNWTSLQV
jgi:hypothetical protein